MDDYEEEVSQLGERKFWSIALGLGFGAAAYTAAMLLNPTIPALTAPLFITGTLGPILGVHNYDNNKIEQKEVENRISHLENIKQTGIPTNKSLDQKKIHKISDLTEERNKEIGNIDAGNLISVVSGILALIAAGVTAFVAPMVWGAVAALIILIASCISTEDDRKRLENLQTRINNLSSDLLYGPAYGYDPEETVEKMDVKTYDHATAKVKTKASQYDESINQYLEGLQNSHDEVLPHQKTKK